ncbi:MAG: hypothetical protein KAT54_08675 [Candidatus Marinimicrobia bacterium]|jgi:hypothetical protein|nr:hypothetical protein [Candidatus Neomarinimicrobiota bacterium]
MPKIIFIGGITEKIEPLSVFKTRFRRHLSLKYPVRHYCIGVYLADTNRIFQSEIFIGELTIL